MSSTTYLHRPKTASGGPTVRPNTKTKRTHTHTPKSRRGLFSSRTPTHRNKKEIDSCNLGHDYWCLAQRFSSAEKLRGCERSCACCVFDCAAFVCWGRCPGVGMVSSDREEAPPEGVEDRCGIHMNPEQWAWNLWRICRLIRAATAFLTPFSISQLVAYYDSDLHMVGVWANDCDWCLWNSSTFARSNGVDLMWP